MEIDASIIIPVKNNQEQLNHCLSSIYFKNLKFSFEVIVVDDNSDNK